MNTSTNALIIAMFESDNLAILRIPELTLKKDCFARFVE
jgi:hypothetical protein